MSNLASYGGSQKTIVTMKRYEIKFVLTKEQVDYLKDAIKDKLKIDQYGLTSIASIYYDTPDDRLIRTSLEKPQFKEKIRLRSYGLAKPGDTVFLELKRKSKGIVYKRRIVTTERKVENFFAYRGDITDDGQIAREITYFRDYYKNLVPRVIIISDREAYNDKDNRIRITIDYNLRYRTKELNLFTSMDGTPLLEKGQCVMEIKTQEAMPLWLAQILSKGKIYKSSFSKAGTAHKKEMLQERI